jgi:hypothetical protein
MLGLYRSGRQADALATFQRARDRLVEELDIQPAAELRELEAQVSAQDPRPAAPSQPLPELGAPLAEVGATFVGRTDVGRTEELRGCRPGWSGRLPADGGCCG